MKKKISQVGVAGSGTMGASIAQILASHGIHVLLYDLSRDQLNKGQKFIETAQDHLIRNAQLSRPEASSILDHIRYSTDVNELAQSDLIIECIVEKMEAKIAFWKEVEKLVSRDTILASNTSGLSIDTMSEDLTFKDRFIGMHWWNPPHLIPLVELIRGKETRDEVVSALEELCEMLHKKSVVVLKDAPGFIGNRLQFALFREALKIYEEGIGSIEDIDKAMKYGPGFRYGVIGPFETADLGGLDTFYSICSYLFSELSQETEVPETLKALVEQVDFGIKNKKGFYDYADGKDRALLAKRDAYFLRQLREE